jgi:hypothetical protein
MVSASISDPAQAKKISDTLIARRDDLVKNWSTGVKGGRSGGLSSRSEQIGMMYVPPSPEKAAAQKASMDAWLKNPELKKVKKITTQILSLSNS